MPAASPSAAGSRDGGALTKQGTEGHEGGTLCRSTTIDRHSDLTFLVEVPDGACWPRTEDVELRAAAKERVILEVNLLCCV